MTDAKPHLGSGATAATNDAGTPSVRTLHAFADDALGDHDAVGTAERIAQGTVTPREVCEAAVNRAAVVDPELAAIVVDRFDAALKQAGALTEQRIASASSGRFAGVPTFIKDMSSVTGLPTRAGTAALRHVGPATKTDPIAQQFEQMGTICLGKSSLPEFGFVCSTEFPSGPATRNPWNLDRSVGGSSGGSAALVASGVVPLAHAADGGGSIRIPAAAAGLVGLKASRGRVIGADSDKLMPVNIGAYGALTRSVRDNCVFMAEAEKLHHLPGMPAIGEVTEPVRRRLKIGVVDRPPTGAVVDQPTLEALQNTVQLLESLGHEVIPMDPPVPASFADDFVAYWATLALAIQVGGKKLFHPSFDAAALTPLTKGLAAHARSNLLKLPGSLRRLRKSGAEHEKLFDSVDVMLSPTVGQIPPAIGHIDMSLTFEEIFPRVMEWACFTPLANATGAPSLSLPLGHDEESNLPIGMLFGAAFGRDRLLLELGLELEAARPFKQISQP